MISPLLTSPTSCLLRGAAHSKASGAIYNMPRQTVHRTAARYNSAHPAAEGSREQLVQWPLKPPSHPDALTPTMPPSHHVPSKATHQRVGRVELIFGPMFAGRCLPCTTVGFPCMQPNSHRPTARQQANPQLSYAGYEKRLFLAVKLLS